MHFSLLLSLLLVIKTIAISEGIDDRPNTERKTLAQGLKGENDIELAYDACFSCCEDAKTGCAESCGCSKPPPEQASDILDLTSLPPTPILAHSKPDRQRCKPTVQNPVACPYPCYSGSQCPCWDYCKAKYCFLLAWSYDSKYSCVSLIVFSTTTKR